MANRQTRRAAKANPSSRIETLERENQSLRDALFSILKQLGRVRVDKDVASSLAHGDGMDVKDLGSSWLFTFEPSNMVVPGGVTNGHANTEPKR